jgi:hypothetical protein
MMIPLISELSLTKVFDRGEPNNECIAIRVNETVEMAQFGILIGTAGSNGMIIPHPDQFFWFGNAVAKSGDWIFVYTGGGTPRLSKATNGTNDVYTLFWNKPKTVLANSHVVPVLFKLGEIQILSAATDVPQSGAPIALSNS